MTKKEFLKQIKQGLKDCPDDMEIKINIPYGTPTYKDIPFLFECYRRCNQNLDPVHFVVGLLHE